MEATEISNFVTGVSVETAKPAPEKRTDQMSCREGGKADWARRQAGLTRETGWGRICATRHKTGATRRGKHARKREAA